MEAFQPPHFAYCRAKCGSKVIILIGLCDSLFKLIDLRADCGAFLLRQRRCAIGIEAHNPYWGTRGE
ncbi:hypothetical protein VI03_21095 [Burkholderia vietnamiensis]|nr:hypothetical protein VI03_21095 [Burkholderia vietnamiensis]